MLQESVRYFEAELFELKKKAPISVPRKFTETMKKLWADSVMRELTAHCNEFHLPESAPQFVIIKI